MRRTKTIALALILIGFIALGITSATSQTQKLQHKEIELKSTSAQLKQLNLDYEHLNLKLDKADKSNSKEIKRLKEEKQRLEKEKARLERDLSAKRNEENGLNTASTRLADALGGTRTASAQGNGSGGCTNNPDANYIYMRESNCSTSVVNPIGCKGLGQSCPASKIAHCGNDFACQHAWFSNYAQERYGGWAGARAFWENNHWW